MICPTCNSSTLDTAITCHQCGAKLITSSVGAPKSILIIDRDVHLRIGGRIGGVTGFFLFILLAQTMLESLDLDRSQSVIGASICAALGGALGRWLVRRHYRLNYLM